MISDLDKIEEEHLLRSLKLKDLFGRIPRVVKSSIFLPSSFRLMLIRPAASSKFFAVEIAFKSSLSLSSTSAEYGRKPCVSNTSSTHFLIMLSNFSVSGSN